MLEHVEPVGVHSGDSACVFPGPSVSEKLGRDLREVASRVAGGLGARGLLNLQKMDTHVAKMLNDGWEILTQTSHTGDRRILRPFAKRDTITVSFRKN